MPRARDGGAADDVATRPTHYHVLAVQAGVFGIPTRAGVLAFGLGLLGGIAHGRP